MSVTTSLNQVDLEAVGALVGKIQQDPEAARTTWATNVRWAGAFRSERQVRSIVRPVFRLRILMRLKAWPLPGLTYSVSTIEHG